MNRFRSQYFGFLIIVLFLTACAPEVKLPVTTQQALVKLSPGEFPVFSDDMSFDSLEISLNQSLDYLKRLNPSQPFRFERDTYPASHLIETLRALGDLRRRQLSERDLQKAIEDSFWVYKSVGRDNRGEVLFTGYYEPLLRGSLHRSADYPYPIYRKPDDWVSVDPSLFDRECPSELIIGRVSDNRVVPYFSRKEIDSKEYQRLKGYELLWVSDQIDLFLLHIQGSGQIALEDGSTVNVGYDCNNGRPYRSIGKFLISEGKIPVEEMSIERIRSFLNENPGEIEKTLSHNERYIFFRLTDHGAMGAIEVPLTAGRSIATDLRLFPKGAPAFIQTEKPVVEKDYTIGSWKSFGRFVLNQDTGGAIQGPGRVDLFWGKGRGAGVAAGRMKHKGSLYFLVLKDK